jgi:hypothetical protein
MSEYIRHNGYVDKPERQCGSKRQYTTKGEAKTAIKRMQSSGTTMNKTGKLTTYRCAHCTYFHVGHYRPPGTPSPQKVDSTDE